MASTRRRWPPRLKLNAGLRPSLCDLLGDDDLRIRCIAHPVGCPGSADSSGKLETSRPLGHDRNRACGAADDGTRGIKRRCRANIHDKAIVLLGAIPRNLRANLHAEKRICLCARNARSSGRTVRRPFHIHGASIRRRSAGIGGAAQLCRIWLRAGILVAFRLSGSVACEHQQTYE